MDAKHFEVTRSDEEWRRLLTPEQYAVMRGHGTERPGSCALNHEKRAGTFSCAGCGQPLFVSKTKFESGTGWPSFNQPVAGSCGSHLGHVFPDGPPPTHQRYCINGVAMNFRPD
jgi:peptide-methionine (R)-S-oxide reductase